MLSRPLQERCVAEVPLTEFNRKNLVAVVQEKFISTGEYKTLSAIKFIPEKKLLDAQRASVEAEKDNKAVNTRTFQPLKQYFKPLKARENGPVTHFEVNSWQRGAERSVGQFLEESRTEDVGLAPLSEQDYWDGMRRNAFDGIEYAADQTKPMVRCSSPVVNVSELASLLHGTRKGDTEGVGSPYFYCGKRGTTFVFHLEDGRMVSVNLHLGGLPKIWYFIFPADQVKFWALLEELFPLYAAACKGFRLHKITHVTPDLLRARGIRYETVVQTEGEVVWTFCLGIHGGFNSGANAGVAMNILLHWCLPFLRQLVFDLDEFCNCEENNKTTFSITEAEYLSLETKACRYHARSAVTEPGVKSLPAPEVQEPPALQVCAVCKAVGSNMRTDMNRLRGTRKLLAGKPVCGPCRNRNQPETRFHKCYICNCSRLKNRVFRPYVYPAPPPCGDGSIHLRRLTTIVDKLIRQTLTQKPRAPHRHFSAPFVASWI